PISLGELADLVREFLPDAQITFDKETGGRELSGNYLIDNSRLVQEFGVQFRPYRQRVLQIHNGARGGGGPPAAGGRVFVLKNPPPPPGGGGGGGGGANGQFRRL